MQQQLAGYAAAISYIEGLTARPLLSHEEVGLARIEALLAAIGHPERRFTAIQVAGTNGKGSTTTMAAAILRSAGHRTGAFTSPHLQSYRERIAVDGDPLDAASWVRLLNRLLPVLARMEADDLPGYTYGRAAFLEVLWAMACLAFVEREVRCAAVETGLGGRLDPTTANTAAVAVLTNVSLDHMERLGRTVEAIAAEKAGLIKPGQLVISAAAGAALPVIRAACAERGATFWHVGEGGEVQIMEEGAGEVQALTIETPLRAHRGIRLGMLGQHQHANAACAVAAVDALSVRAGIEIPLAAVLDGLAEARIPGRMELIAGSPEILMDGAHNAAGAAALAEALRTYQGGRRIVLLLGILGDKDMATITDRLTPLAAAVIVSEPPWSSRAGFSAQVADRARSHVAHVEVHTQPAEALARARALAGADDLIVVAGSLYLVGAVRDVLCPSPDGPDPA